MSSWSKKKCPAALLIVTNRRVKHVEEEAGGVPVETLLNSTRVPVNRGCPEAVTRVQHTNTHLDTRACFF